MNTIRPDSLDFTDLERSDAKTFDYTSYDGLSILSGNPLPNITENPLFKLCLTGVACSVIQHVATHRERYIGESESSHGERWFGRWTTSNRFLYRV